MIPVKIESVNFDPADIGLFKSNINPSSIIDKLALPDNFGIYQAIGLLMSNPHLVLFCKNILNEEKIKSLWASLGNHFLFRNKINISFGTIISENKIDLSIFKRGAILIRGYGSGDFVSTAIAYNSRLIKSKNILVNQKGDSLRISMDKDANISQIEQANDVF